MLPLRSLLPYLTPAFLGAFTTWWVMDAIAQKKELAHYQALEAARQKEQERNAAIVQKHAEDLFAVLEHYRRNPVRVSVPVHCPAPGEPPGRVDVAPEDVLLVVGGVASGDRKAAD